MSFLYLITIYPIEWFYFWLFKFYIHVTGSYGASLLLLSLFTTILYVPLKRLAGNLHRKETMVSEAMAPQMAQIKATLHGEERQAAINRLYRRYAYHPFLAMRSSVGILIQVPFLIAAYNMIHGFTPLAGHSFGVIGDLFLPDRLLGTVNLLPILMTIINLMAVWTTPGFTKRDLGQAIFVALLFLVLLYPSPSALLIYWTSNNTLYFVGNMMHRSKALCKLGQRMEDGLFRLVGSINPFTLAVALLAALGLFIYFPFTTYLRNPNEFAFNGFGLLAGMAPPFLATLVAVFALLALAGRLLPRYELKFLTQSHPVTVAHLALLFVVLASLFEGIFMSRGLPRLTGEAGLFDSTSRLVVDSAVWLALVALPIVFKRDVFEQMSRLAGVAILIMAIGLVSAYRGGEEKLPVAVTAADVRQNLGFSREKNVIAIMADSFPTETAKAILAKEPAIAAKFTGFTLFVNNLGAGGGTEYAIPQILRGRLWSEGTILEFDKALKEDPAAIPQAFWQKGYDVFISSDGMDWINVATRDGRALSSGLVKFRLNGHAYKQILFRFAPYLCKRLWNEELAIPVAEPRSPDDPLTGPVDKLYQDLAKGASRESSRPTLHYHLYNGVHAPYLKDRDGSPLPKEERFADSGLLKSGEWELKSCGQYLDFLKKAGLYDSSTIILMADHGRGDEHRFPFFMVKPAGAGGELAYSEAPTSGLYVKDVAEWLADGRSLAEWAASLPETRQQCAPPDKYYGEVRGVDKGQLIFGDEREIKVDTRE